MPDTIVIEILNICLEADRKANKLYKRFALLTKTEELRDFWQNLANEEIEHCGYWQKLIDLAKDDLLPKLFDQPFKVKEELMEVDGKVADVIMQSEKDLDEPEMFLLAYRLEFYLLHPAILNFLNFLETMPNVESPLTNYKDHLMGFVMALNRFGKKKPELELLGETIQRLWKDNTTLVVMSSTDSLTGIYNRRGMYDALLPLIYLAQRKKLGIGILVVDIDDFKKINDTQGHQVGDDALAWLATALKANIRISDVIGRYGGDEFLIYLSDVNLDYLFTIAVKLRKIVEAESKEVLPFTISIGVSGGLLGTDIENDLQAMIKRADGNLYKAKQAGKNTVAIDPTNKPIEKIEL